KSPAIPALRKAVAIKIGWREYSDEYLSMASAVSRTPDVLLGFKSFMEHPARRPQLSELVKQKISDEQPPADGRPSAQQRVAALKRGKAKEQQVDEQPAFRSEEHTSELQSREKLVCRLLLEKKKNH